MELAGTRSWRISEDRWPEAFDVALWFRATERIDVPAGGIVPGPAEIQPLPDRTAAHADGAELAAGWLAWWQALAGVPPLRAPLALSRPPPELVFVGPDPAGLAGWPVLQRAVAARWREAKDWHDRRKRVGLAAGPPHDLRTVHAVRDLERELGRRAEPFDLDFVLLRSATTRSGRSGRIGTCSRRACAAARSGRACSVSFSSRTPDTGPVPDSR